MKTSACLALVLFWTSLSHLDAIRLSTKEFLECRTNLSIAIKNDTIFHERINEADYIFTGKIKDLRHGHLHARVKRAIKGVLNNTLDLVINDTCGFYVRRGYTGIFLAKRHISEHKHPAKVVMHFGPVPLTLTNLDKFNAAVRVTINRCRADHFNLAFSLKRVGIVKDDTCRCGKTPETLNHILWQCDLYDLPRIQISLLAKPNLKGCEIIFWFLKKCNLKI
ncbi:uncharacterized protein [Prorops nasuta]|uniref:uncharacterized protein n=1 Tax=Prorops nasuta TaxID=863751 RepID=UPI0034CF1336